MPDRVVTDRYMLIICLYSKALLPLLLTWLRNSTMASEDEFEQQITEIKRKGLAECMLQLTKKDKECLQ